MTQKKTPPDQNAEQHGRKAHGIIGARSRVVPVVGVGASAGGLGPFQAFVNHIPQNSGVAWIFIQHMSPDKDSHLQAILAEKTPLPVSEVYSGVKVEPDRIYVIAPGQRVTLAGDALQSVKEETAEGRRTSIDTFLLSLAEDRGAASGCALLSGAGTDGTMGLRAIKEAGGLTLTQAIATAEHDSMILSAVRTGLVDKQMLVEQMPLEFARFFHSPVRALTKLPNGDRLKICEILRRASGHDFSGYKNGTIERRIQRRMQMLNVSQVSEYITLLESDKDEPQNLFRDLLVGVTQFFRDREAFAALERDVLPAILKGKSADDEVRIWVPACASGEEVYSLAMILQENAYRLSSPPRLRVFGSDIDGNALHVARIARYPKSIEADVSQGRLARFFEKEDGTYVVRPSLREICLFAQHNVLRDAPFSRIDLLSCRNFLIYLEGQLQKRLMPVFHYALRSGGFLFLGPAENPPEEPKLFLEADRKYRIFRSFGEAARLPEFPLVPGEGPNYREAGGGLIPAPEPGGSFSFRAARRLLERFAPAYVIIDENYDILETSKGTGAYLEFPGGRPRANLSDMARDGLALEVKAAVSKVMQSGTSAIRRATLGTRRISISVERFPAEKERAQLYLVVFQELPEESIPKGRRDSLSSDEELVRALEQELRTTKERLQSTTEELETSNEELKASNEELMSVNEELQSSNEELETSREELQSINEELSAVNLELRNRVDELSHANSDLKNLFANTRIPMLFMSENYRIMNFTPAAKSLFRLLDHDIGRPLDDLAKVVEFDDLKEEVKTVVIEGQSVEKEVEELGASGHSRTFLMRILPYEGEQNKREGAVLTFIDITERKESERRLATMVSELNHRVKNALSIVQSVLHQAGKRASSVAEFQEFAEGRIWAISTAHALLSESGWSHASLGRILKDVLQQFCSTESGRLDFSGPSIEVRPDATVPLALIFQELGTNAIKYGAWSNGMGKVIVKWEFVQSDNGTVRIEWREQVGAAVRAQKHTGFGLDFIRRSTDYDLKGKCEQEFSESGFRCSFELPAEGTFFFEGDRP